MTTIPETTEQQRAQAQRVDNILRGLLHPKVFHSTYLYTDEGISFHVEDANRHSLLESNIPQPARSIGLLSDEEIETKLRVKLEQARHPAIY